MELFETKKNMNEMNNSKKLNKNNSDRHNYGAANSKKPLFLERSDYGWDGDY